ncbi:hypothetical protein BC777_2939 [Yoonia maricola]|uniref:Uncharacterized protein n=1 Tax=Yoonia maricola TaxID=420999 RepID=A0A2M8W1Z7_9RHOB|nr:hypothetical protein [Yoonia maricola]PJI84945.1 hypothetical protein BC777_2939 [Yoonia maricola]
MRWLLGGQVVIALFLILADVAGMLPTLFNQASDAPALNRPTQPGDQTRRYQPSNPTQPGAGIDPNMPSQLTLTTQRIDTVTLRGAIAPGDGVRITAELQRIAPETVRLDSPGGSVSDALEIGRVLRQLEVATQIADESVCLSACPYIFVGGVQRSTDTGARLGVHQHSFGESTILPAFLATQDIQSGQAEVLAHLDEMGIDLRIMGPALATPANEIYILTQTELTDWNVVSDVPQ